MATLLTEQQWNRLERAFASDPLLGLVALVSAGCAVLALVLGGGFLALWLVGTVVLVAHREWNFASIPAIALGVVAILFSPEFNGNILLVFLLVLVVVALGVQYLPVLYLSIPLLVLSIAVLAALGLMFAVPVFGQLIGIAVLVVFGYRAFDKVQESGKFKGQSIGEVKGHLQDDVSRFLKKNWPGICVAAVMFVAFAWLTFGSTVAGVRYQRIDTGGHNYVYPGPMAYGSLLVVLGLLFLFVVPKVERVKIEGSKPEEPKDPLRGLSKVKREAVYALFAVDRLEAKVVVETHDGKQWSSVAIQPTGYSIPILNDNIGLVVDEYEKAATTLVLETLKSTASLGGAVSDEALEAATINRGLLTRLGITPSQLATARRKHDREQAKKEEKQKGSPELVTATS